MENLFDDFERNSIDQWKEKIISELKGKSFNQLIWESPEGIEISPIHNSQTAPKFSGQVTHNHLDWKIEDSIIKPKNNKKIVKSIYNGANSILIKECKSENIESVLNEVLIQDIEISFKSDQIEKNLDAFKQVVKKRNLNVNKINGSLHYDPLMHGLKNGKFDLNIWEEFQRILKKSSLLKKYKSISIQGHEYHNFGANTSQELSYTIAQLSEYLSHQNHLCSDNIQISLGISCNYLFEIAKFRAIRILTAQIFKAYNRNNNTLHLRAETGLRTSTIYDAHINLLRSTSQTMSAAIGGANIINVNNYNSIFKIKDDNAQRLGRNISLILKEESFFNKVSDPAAGSYFIEYLTNKLCIKAWSMFQEIEKIGGWVKAIQSNFIQKAIIKNRDKEQENFNAGEISVLGSNLFPNKTEKINSLIEKKVEYKYIDNTIDFIALEKRRLSEKIDVDRLIKE